jgi:hypothetical protein
MIRVTKIRELLLTAATSEKRAPHIAAASGLVHVKDKLYVVADDELHLGVFSAEHASPGALVRLFDGKLPEKPKKRKAEKPDLETLTSLPPFAGYPQGALFALGSGSKPNRDAGVIIGLDADGVINTAPRPIELGALYDQLRVELSALNIEGAVVSGADLVLLQRGNKGSANAIIRCRLQDVLQDLAKHDALRLHKPPVIQLLELGHAEGVPLCFSDGAALPNGSMLFTAIAEDTDNSIDDGACIGSAIGVMTAEGKVTRMERLEPGYKVEGIVATVNQGEIQVRLVTDDDDAGKPAWLLAAKLPW